MQASFKWNSLTTTVITPPKYVSTSVCHFKVIHGKMSESNSNKPLRSMRLWCREKGGVKISDTLQIRVVHLFCCCTLYLLVIPKAFKKGKGKIIKKEIRNTTIKKWKRNEKKVAERKRNTRHKKGKISVSPSYHAYLRVMHRSLILTLRESDKPRHSVSICEGVLTPVKMYFLNTIWGCTE